MGFVIGRVSGDTSVHSGRRRTSMPPTYGITIPNGHSSESTRPIRRAGLPAPSIPAGTSAVTTLPAPTSAFSPMVMSGRLQTSYFRLHTSDFILPTSYFHSSPPRTHRLVDRRQRANDTQTE